ncbi:MAG: hypothetical protein WAM94_15320 [Chromatiaceae bacterium]|jgi:hypothetical protein
MIEILFFIAVGIVIGWNLPQPPWAREFQEKVVLFFRDLFGKSR